MIALEWWQLAAGLLFAGAVGAVVDRLRMRRWLQVELDRAVEQLRRQRQLEQQPDELARRLRDRGDVDGMVVVLSGVLVLAFVIVLQLAVKAGYL